MRRWTRLRRPATTVTSAMSAASARTSPPPAHRTRMRPMSEAGLRLDDSARAAASAPTDSILLEAPAGSGKTAVLTRRFLRLLATVEDPGQILAITFTRKAAAEMRARVIRALRGEFPPEDPEAAELTALARVALAHAAARGWDIDTNPQSLRIQTIDGLNYWLASQLPV